MFKRLSPHNLKAWYERYERPLSSISLIGGFVLDALTLQRVDTLFENLRIVLYLVIAFVGIVAMNYIEEHRKDTLETSKWHFWLLILIQFAIGGLLSPFLVFYFRSATLSVSWPFMLLLAGAFILNERFKKHYVRLTFQLNLLFVSIFSFTIYFLPVITHKMGVTIFLLSGVLSLVILALLLWVLWYVTKERFKKSRWMLGWSILAIYAAVHVLYFTNLIPPIPLAMKEAGVYYSVSSDGRGGYTLVGEDPHWFDGLGTYKDYTKISGEPLYVFTAIFSPTNLNTTVVHHWQWYDPSIKEWISTNRVNLPINGGREGGFRTYSSKLNIKEGYWRVDVETQQGQNIGRVKFKVIE